MPALVISHKMQILQAWAKSRLWAIWIVPTYVFQGMVIFLLQCIWKLFATCLPEALPPLSHENLWMGLFSLLIEENMSSTCCYHKRWSQALWIWGNCRCCHTWHERGRTFPVKSPFVSIVVSHLLGGLLPSVFLWCMLRLGREQSILVTSKMHFRLCADVGGCLCSPALLS